MQGIRPDGLTNEELERYSYLQAGALPQEWVNILQRQFAATLEPREPQPENPNQLNLFD